MKISSDFEKTLFDFAKNTVSHEYSCPSYSYAIAKQLTHIIGNLDVQETVSNSHNLPLPIISDLYDFMVVYPRIATLFRILL